MSVREGPESAASLNARGMDLTAGERYEEAIAAFDRALDLEPGNAGLRYNRGEAYRRAGRSAEAQADLEAVLAAEGETADLLLALGLVAYEADDFELASSRYERALVLKIGLSRGLERSRRRRVPPRRVCEGQEGLREGRFPGSRLRGGLAQPGRQLFRAGAGWGKASRPGEGQGPRRPERGRGLLTRQLKSCYRIEKGLS